MCKSVTMPGMGGHVRRNTHGAYTCNLMMSTAGKCLSPMLLGCYGSLRLTAVSYRYLLTGQSDDNVWTNFDTGDAIMGVASRGAAQGAVRTDQEYLQRQALGGFCFALAGILFLIVAAGTGGNTMSNAVACALALVGSTMQLAAFRRLSSRRSG